MKTAAVMIVRNEVDIVPINIAYHRSMGIEDFWIVDNGSTDGTAQLLRALASQNSWLRWRSEPGAFRQSEFASGLAQEAFRAGAEWIVPIDADEFWWTSSGELVGMLEYSDAGALVCQVDNFVQSARVRHDHPASLTTMTRRAQSVGTVDGARSLVESRDIAFVEMKYPPKLIHRASADLVIGAGNHTGTGHTGDTEAGDSVGVLHAPVRSRSRLCLLAEHGRRTAAIDRDPGSSWHLVRWANLEASGGLDEDWIANSYRSGGLRIGSQHHALVKDRRLRSAVLPFISRMDRMLGPIRSVVQSSELPRSTDEGGYSMTSQNAAVEIDDSE